MAGVVRLSRWKMSSHCHWPSNWPVHVVTLPTGPCPARWASLTVRNASNILLVRDLRFLQRRSSARDTVSRGQWFPTFRRNSVPCIRCLRVQPLNAMAGGRLTQRHCVAFLNTAIPRHSVAVACLLLIVHHIWKKSRS